MRTIAVNMDEKVAEKVLWFLDHLKNEGVEGVSVEDIADLKLLEEAKREKKRIPLEEIIKEYGIEG